METNKINHINKVLKEFFASHPNEGPVPALAFMPHFIEAGVYKRDYKKGLPIRKDLRALDKNGELHLIPFALPMRKAKNTSWFFVPPSDKEKPLVAASFLRSSQTASSQKVTLPIRDEHYILDLCDKVLQHTGSRQHSFDFLFGDLHRNGKTSTKLRCDIYYPSLKLVVEYNETQHTQAVPHFDKPTLITVSGVHRGEQRKRYDMLRRSVLPQHGLTVVDLSYTDFEHNNSGKLLRNPINDIEIVKERLKTYL